MPNFDDNQVASTASSRFQRVSARKARLLADLIRGQSVTEATRILQMTHRPSAGAIVSNLLKSAVANADHGKYENLGALVVGDIQVGGGPIMYRFRPRARGRASKIRKRSCHLSITLIEA
jgi:large subunit ribosomal protein L22